jgi:predicted small metal-binding protein
MILSYACSDYPGMDTCAGNFTADTTEELWRHIEVHASIAHGEDPAKWSADERSEVEKLITSSS